MALKPASLACPEKLLPAVEAAQRRHKPDSKPVESEGCAFGRETSTAHADTTQWVEKRRTPWRRRDEAFAKLSLSFPSPGDSASLTLSTPSYMLSIA